MKKMALKILVISGDYSYKNDFQKASLNRSIEVDYAETMAAAVDLLARTEYCMVIVRADTVDSLSDITSMRTMRQVPVIIFSYCTSSIDIGSAKCEVQFTLNTPNDIDFLAEASATMARYYSNFKGEKRYKNPDVFSYKNLFLVSETHQVFLKEKQLWLTRKEFDLLKYFMANRGTTLTYEQIHNSVWGYDHLYETNNLLHSLVHRLRKKLLSEPDGDDYITSVWEVGYKFGASD
jgi:DNA-binding response OmpR family regulator